MVPQRNDFAFWGLRGFSCQLKTQLWMLRCIAQLHWTEWPIIPTSVNQLHAIGVKGPDACPVYIGCGSIGVSGHDPELVHICIAAVEPVV